MNNNTIYLNPLELKSEIIPHINFTGIMGTSIKSYFSYRYRQILNNFQTQEINLGNINIDLVTDEIKLVNLSVLDNNNKLNYKALAIALHKLYQYSQKLQITPLIPFGIGCGLLGGDWDKIETLINK